MNGTDNLTRTPQTDVEAPRRSFAPPVDIFENQDELLIVADVPGVAKDDVKIDFEDGKLAIFGKRGQAEAYDWHRAFVVPQGIDADRISADLSQGVLSVRLPKQEALKPRQIAVRAN
ncbi:MAG: Hsp20/alpha crystallin family protein [Polyangiaceae bacterium]